MQRFASFALLVLLAASAAPGLEPLPSLPMAPEPALCLPRLAKPFVADGIVNEWDGVPLLPARSAACIGNRRPSHAWQGPVDCGMDVYAAWTTNGLCIAAVVTDDDVRNTRESAYYEQDCIEVFADGRAAPAFMTAPYSTGCYQILIRAPRGGAPSAHRVVQPHPALAQLDVGSRLTASGYAVELLLPWAAFPELKPGPGARVALMAAVDESDARDGETSQPLQMAWNGVSDHYRNPASFVAFELGERFETGPEAELGPMVGLVVPALVDTSATVTVRAEVTAPLSRQARQVMFRALSPAGKVVFAELAPLVAASNATPDELVASVDWPVTGLPNGFHRMTASLVAADGTTMGSRGRSVLLLANALNEVGVAFRSVDFAAVAQSRPFLAASWLAAGAAADRFRTYVAAGDVGRVKASHSELRARLAVLQGGSTGRADGLLDLLSLTTVPEAQVTVEYPSSSMDRAGITFYCGALPLVTVDVQEYSAVSGAEARVQSAPLALADGRWVTSLDGMKAWVATQVYDFVSCPAANVRPERDALLFARGRPWVLGIEHLDIARPEAVATTESCPEELRAALSAWAAGRQVPLVTVSQALARTSALIGGPASDHALSARVGPAPRLDRVTPVRRFAGMTVLSGRRTYSVYGPCRPLAEQALRLAIAGARVSLAQTDALRAALVDAMAPAGTAAAAPAAGLSLFCGDVHMHTFYSDGAGSPVALTLQSLSDFMDFSVMSDHNTLDGALVRAGLFGPFGFGVPLIVGQEITTGWAHFNAYPLRSVVDWTGTDASAIVEAAHAQGAVIQWNHPGYPGSDWDAALQERGFGDSGLDAWEHYSPRHADWLAAGRVPVLVGSTDTHSGTFDQTERTLVLAGGVTGPELAAAVREGRVALLTSDGPAFLYGSRAVTDAAWAALADGAGLRAAWAARLKAALRRADLAELLRAAPARVVAPEPAVP